MLKKSVVYRTRLVPKERHPLYAPPEKGEQYCYRRGRIAFDGVRSTVWAHRSDAAYRDATGELDRGNIDWFPVVDGRYALAGDWGEV